jgi:pimeloyl-ACP methyl ester carboxylesterase
VLVLPGGPGLSSRSVAPVSELLRNRFRVARIENTCNSIHALLEGIEAARKQLSEGRWFVIGHGWGAAMAALYAAVHPERVRGVVLAHPIEISSDYYDVAAECSTGEGYDLSAVARRITAPAMVLLGDRDPMDRRSGMRWAELSKAHAALLPDCGRQSFVEQPRRFQQAVTEFLQVRISPKTVAAA